MRVKLLSICIPTYNRAEVLNETLQQIVSDPYFNSELIQVVVSDNCSTDNTKNIVGNYPFIDYYRNEENIGDSNFYKVLSYGQGLYLKLCNDTVRFNEGKLREILLLIDQYKNCKQNLLFYQNSKICSNGKYTIRSGNQFLYQVSYHTTWIANFGCWRWDLKAFKKPTRFVNLNFSQVDWTYQLINNYDRSILYVDDFFQTYHVKKKGGYNLFEVFGQNYFKVLSTFRFSLLIKEVEKYRLFRYFFIPWIKNLIVDENKEYTFKSKNYLKILLSMYWYHLYIYPILLALVALKIIKLLLKGNIGLFKIR